MTVGLLESMCSTLGRLFKFVKMEPLKETTSILQATTKSKEKTMTRKEAIAGLKKLIKEMSAEQKEDKAFLRQPHKGYVGSTQACCVSRADKITAALNYYNEIRGKEYRHGTNEHTEHSVAWQGEKLRKEFVIDVVEEEAAA